MRLIERNEVPEEHFSEGEPDLEPPEELCLGERDEEQVLEEELDNEDISEEEVDDVTLELTLEDLVHQSEPDGEETPELDAVADSEVEPADSELADLEVGDLEDIEESLDRILADRLASDGSEVEDEPEEEDAAESHNGAARLGHVALHLGAPGSNGSAVSGCRDDEFVCTSCYLVHKRAQLSDPLRGICRDCSG